MRRFFAEPANFVAGRVRLDSGETHHLEKVLRLPVGEVVRVFDGKGNEFECKIEKIRSDGAELEVLQVCSPSAPESPLELAVAAAVTPGEKFDLVVQKCVELGVLCLFPLFTARCEVKQASASRKIKRWRTIAKEAAKQCGRARLMMVKEPRSLDDFLDDGQGTLLFFSERDGGPLGQIEDPKKLSLIFGPKGGWEDHEIEAAQSAGCRVVTFGGRILRAETAAISITAIIQNRFGDLN